MFKCGEELVLTFLGITAKLKVIPPRFKRSPLGCSKDALRPETKKAYPNGT